jgi:hypothetical protein
MRYFQENHSRGHLETQCECLNSSRNCQTTVSYAVFRFPMQTSRVNKNIYKLNSGLQTFRKLSVVYYSGRTQRFGNWICSRPQVKRLGSTYSVGSDRRSYLIYRSDSAFEMSRYFRIPDVMNKVQKCSNLCVIYSNRKSLEYIINNK